MRHGARTQSFNRPYNHRKWLMRNLAVSLVEHERITTTLAKAKELRRVVEKAITFGKKGTLADRRLLLSRFPNQEMVSKIFSVLAPRYSSRPGGYTRILKVLKRAGDNAEMAIIELVDAQIKSQQVADPKAKKAASVKAKAEKTAKKEARAAKEPAKEKKAAKATTEEKAPKKAAKKTK